MSAPKCGAKGPQGRTCNALLRERVDRFGALTWSCPRCARRKAGICAECPRPVDGIAGRAERCAAHRHAARRQNKQFCKARDPERTRRIDRESHARARVRARRGGPPMDRQLKGLLAGIARAAALTPAQRREIARRAGLASGRARRERMAA